MPDEPRFLKDPPPGPLMGVPRTGTPPSAPPPPAVTRKDGGFSVGLNPDWRLQHGPGVVMSTPLVWAIREDPRGLAWNVVDDRGRKAEVFLHAFGFEKSVPPLDEFVETQRELVRKHGALARIAEDRALVHRDLPAHLLVWTSIEPTGERWTFRAAYLRSPIGIHILKLDQEGDVSSQLAREHEQVFSTMSPR